MSEQGGENTPRFEHETGSAENLARALHMSEEDVLAAGREAVEEVESARGQGRESILRSFVDALASSWKKMDLGLLSSRDQGIPIREWTRESLRQEYALWSKFQTGRGDRSKFAEMRKSMLDEIGQVAKEKNIWSYVVLGMDIDARSALDLDAIVAEEVERENEKVGEAYRNLIYDLSAARLDPEPQFLAQLYKEWIDLQNDPRNNLPRVFNQRDIDSYSLSAKAALKAFAAIERAVEEKGIPADQWQSLLAQAEPTERIRETVDQDAVRELRSREINERVERMVREERDRVASGGERAYHIDPREIISRMEDSGAFADLNPEQLASLADAAARTSASPKESTYKGVEKTITRESATEWERQSQDYHEIKRALLRPGADWEVYGWNAEERRQTQQWLMDRLGLDSYGANVLMAALLLRGRTGASTWATITQWNDARVDPQQALEGHLQRLNVFRTDSEAHEIFDTDPERRKRYHDQYYNDVPEYFEDLGWQVSYLADKIYQNGGSLAIVNSRVREVVDPDTGKKRFEFREVVNTDNMFAWLRRRVKEEDGKHTTDPLDFEQVVKLEKSGLGVPIDIYSLLDKVEGKMFRSRYDSKKDFKFMAGELERHAIIAGAPRTSRIVYKQKMHDRKGLLEQRFQEEVNDIFTRKLGWQSLLESLHQMSERGQASKDFDGKIGAVAGTIHMAYSNVLNLPEMAKILGFDDGPAGLREFGDMFNLYKLQKLAQNFAKSKDGGTVDWSLLLNLNMGKSINGVKLADVFNDDGSPKLETKEQRNKFSNLINIFTYKAPNESMENVFRSIVAERAAELHGLRTTINGEEYGANREYAERVAFDMMYLLGMANHVNITNQGGFSEEGKMTGDYRLGQITDKSGAWGNMWSIGMYKRWLLPAAHVITTTEIDPNTGNRKTIYQVMEEAQRARRDIDRRVRLKVDQLMRQPKVEELIARQMEIIRSKGTMDGKGEESIRKRARDEVRMDIWDQELNKLRDVNGNRSMDNYRRVTEQFVFDKNAMYDYHVNHYKRGYQIDERLRLAKEFKFDDYITEDSMLGATFKHDKFQSDFAEFATIIRKFIENSNLEHSTEIWAWDYKTKEMKLMKIGEALFSKQILNLPQFIDKRTGEIDWKKVNTKDGKRLLTKSFLSAYITAQLLQYRDLSHFNTSPRYSFAMTQNILDAISRIPGGLEFDETDARRNKVTGSYFGKQFMRRIKEQSSTTTYKMYLFDMLSSGLFGAPGKKTGMLSGIAAAFSKIAEASFSGAI